MTLVLLKDFDFNVDGEVITRKKGETFEAENHKAFTSMGVAKKYIPKKKVTKEK